MVENRTASCIGGPRCCVLHAIVLVFVLGSAPLVASAQGIVVDHTTTDPAVIEP